jgi:hypothetical protein
MVNTPGSEYPLMNLADLPTILVVGSLDPDQRLLSLYRFIEEVIELAGRADPFPCLDRKLNQRKKNFRVQPAALHEDRKVALDAEQKVPPVGQLRSVRGCHSEAEFKALMELRSVAGWQQLRGKSDLGDVRGAGPALDGCPVAPPEFQLVQVSIDHVDKSFQKHPVLVGCLNGDRNPNRDVCPNRVRYPKAQAAVFVDGPNSGPR